MLKILLLAFSCLKALSLTPCLMPLAKQELVGFHRYSIATTKSTCSFLLFSKQQSTAQREFGEEETTAHRPTRFFLLRASLNPLTLGVTTSSFT